jgi:ribosomal protein S8
MLLFYFMVSLKIANKNNKNFIYIYPSKQILSLVLILFKTGFISGFSLIKHKKNNYLLLKIYLKHKTYLKNPIKKIILFSGLNKDVFINVRRLHFIKSNIFFINTILGQVTSNNAKKSNLGGKLSFYLT